MGGEGGGGGVGVDLAGGDAEDGVIEGLAFDGGKEAAEEGVFRRFQDVLAGALAAAVLQCAGLVQVGAVGIDGVGESGDALLLRGDGEEYGGAVGIRGVVGEVEHAVEFGDEGIGTGAVGLVDDEDVGDLEDAGLEGLDGIAHAGDGDDDGGVGGGGDIDLILTGADGLEDDDIVAGGVEDGGDIAGSFAEAAEGAAGGHAAEEDAGISGEVLHPDAVAEECAAGVGAGGVDGDDADGVAAAALFAGECADDGAFAGAGGAGDTDDSGVAGARVESADGFEAGGGAVFHVGDSAGKGAAISGEQALDEVVWGHAFAPVFSRTNSTTWAMGEPGPKTVAKPIFFKIS